MAFRFLSDSNNTGIVLGEDVSENQNVFDGGGTIMGWINIDGWGGLDFGRMAEKDGITQHGWYWFVSGPSAPGGVDQGFGFVQRFSGTFGEWESPAGSVLLNTWHHLAVGYNSSSTTNNAQFSIDGQSVTTTEISSPTGTRDDDSGARPVLGNRLSDYARQFFGRMADFRVYDRILTDGEIQTIHAARGTDTILNGLIRRFPMSPQRESLGPNTAYKFVTNNSILGSTLTLNVPTTHLDGDLLVMIVGDGANTSGTAPVINTPSGWTERIQFTTAAAASRPSIAVFTRIASSEPSSYNVTSNQGSTPKVGYIYNFHDIASEVPTASSNSTGTSSSPTAPSVTPTDPNSLLIRICGFDDSTKIPNPRASFYPKEISGRRVQGIQGGGSNGLILCIGEEHWNDTACPIRTFTGSSSDQWGTATLAWTVNYSTGIEGLAAKDISPFKAHATVQERGIVGGTDILKVGGC